MTLARGGGSILTLQDDSKIIGRMTTHDVKASRALFDALKQAWQKIEVSMAQLSTASG